MLGHDAPLPAPAAGGAADPLGLSAGPGPGGPGRTRLAVRGGGEGPLVCVAEDGQWLARASTQALRFAARRLTADPGGWYSRRGFQVRTQIIAETHADPLALLERP